MSDTIGALIEVLTEKGGMLDEMRNLLEEEQACIIALDLARMAANQEEIDRLTGEMDSLNNYCRLLLERTGEELGLAENNTLSPIIDRVPPTEKERLSGLQKRLYSCSAALDSLLAVNKGLLEDSLGLVERSISFFNGVFGTGNTYGEEGRLIARRTGSRLVCKEI